MDQDFIYIDVRVVNYKVPKAARAHYFPCDAYMVDGPKFAAFSAEEFKTWIYVLSMCARQRTCDARVNLVHARRNARLRTSSIVSALRKLEQIQAIEIKTDNFYPLREEKRREEKRRGEDIGARKKTAPKSEDLEPASRTPSESKTTLELIPSEAGSESAGEVGTPASRCVGEFIDRWKSRHGGKYPLSGKDAALIKGLVKSLGESRTVAIFDAYFKMPDAWITGRKHDVVTLNSNLAKVAAFADTGEFITQTQVKQMDRSATTMSLMDRIKRGEV